MAPTQGALAPASSTGGTKRPPATIAAIIDEAGFGTSQIRLLLILGLCWIADAMEVMILSFLGPELVCQWGISSTAEGLLTTAVFIGMMFGATFWGYLSDIYGRKRILLVSSALVLGAALVSAAVQDLGGMLVARGVMGVGIGGIPVAFSLFMEFIPSNTRGMWGVIIDGVWWALGSILQAGLAYAILPTLGWRWLLVISSAPLMVFLALFAALAEESPRYLLSRGRVAEAEAVLDRMLIANGRPDLAGVTLIQPPPAGAPKALTDGAAAPLVPGRPSSPRTQEGAAPKQGLVGQVTEQITTCACGFYTGVLALFQGPGMARLTSSLLLLWLCNAVCYYGIILLASALSLADHEGGVCNGAHSSLDGADFVDLLVQSVAELPGTLIAAWAIDRSSLGRKWLQAVMFAVAGVAFFLIIPFPPGFIRTAVMFVGRGASFGVFLVTYTYTPEVYPTHLRTTGFGIANSFGRIGGMIAPFIGQGLVASGHTTEAAVIFGMFCVIAVATASSLQHETANKTLEEATGGPAEAAEAPAPTPAAPASGLAQSDASLEADVRGVLDSMTPAKPRQARGASISEVAAEIGSSGSSPSSNSSA